jgi:predicted aspartyl protease
MRFGLFAPIRQTRRLIFIFVVGVLPSVVFCASQETTSRERLDELIESKSYLDFERELPLASVSRNDRLYFDGILADHLNRPSQAISLLERVLPELVRVNQRRAAIALNALAEDEFMVGRYSEATARYAELLQHFDSFLDASERQTVQDNHDTMALLGNAPAQAISGERSFTVRTRQDQLGDMDVPLKVGARTEWWIFDTGANISTIATSTAKRLGLAVSKGHAQTKAGATGAEVSLSTALIPEVTFGRAVIRNMVVLVIDDKELGIDLGPRGSYQITGILGYPVLAAMQSFTVNGNEMQIGSSPVPPARTARLYVDELTLLIAGRVSAKNLIFQFDTGNAGADLTARFLKQFPERFASLKSEQARFGGAGGSSATAVYRLPELQLDFGSVSVRLPNLSLFNGNRGELLDKLYGNLGQGLLQRFENYTVDFARMQLRLGPPVSK